MTWYGKSDFQFLQTIKKVSIKNYTHSFFAETGYIFSVKNIFATALYLPGIILMASTRQFSFLKLYFKNYME